MEELQQKYAAAMQTILSQIDTIFTLSAQNQALQAKVDKLENPTEPTEEKKLKVVK